MKPRGLFRWRAIGVLVLVLIGLGVLWMLFGDWLVEDTTEEASTELLGTQVDIAGLHLRETEARVEIARLQVADPFHLDHNLLETGPVVLDLDPAALLEKKLVIDQLRITGLRFGTRRATPARAVSGGGFAPGVLSQVRAFTRQFDVPLLTLTPIDTVRQLVLNPDQLTTIREAKRLVSEADSVQAAFRADLANLNIRAPLDSARALADRLEGANPARLGVAGTRQAVQSVRDVLRELDQARERVKALEQAGHSGVARLRSGVSTLDQARQRDYEFARGLLQLPGLDAPEIGKALFGHVSLDRFQQALYWAELARKYLPPGLQPRARPAGRALRANGTTVAFPRVHDQPAFLLRDGAIDVAFDAFGATHTLAARVLGLTTQPSLYGRPATVQAEGSVGGDHPMQLRAGALLDHTGRAPRDSAHLNLAGVPLPGFTVPGLGFRVEPGQGTTGLDFVMSGDRIEGTWRLSSQVAQWSRDSAGTGNTLHDLVWRVLSGLHQLEVTARLSGTLRAPEFQVHSNLDQALADRVRAVLGEEVAAAEARVRAQVDSLIGAARSQATERVNLVSAEVDRQVAGVREEVDQARARVEARLKALTGGLGGVLNLPGS